MVRNPPPLEMLRLLAKVFTRPVFMQLARGDDPKHCLQFLQGSGLVPGTQRRSLTQVLDDLWLDLRCHYRNEYVFKSLLANRIVFGRHSPRTASCHVELPVGGSIVDLAVANGATTAYEIKTEFDSPHRLDSQTRAYLKAFDRVYVVAHEKQAAKYLACSDPRAGVLALTQREALVPLREATPNATNVCPRTIFRMLRRAEYVPAVEARLGRKLDVPNGVIADLCAQTFATFDPHHAHAILVAALRARTTDASMVAFVRRLPPSLRVLGYATPLSNVARARLTTSLEGLAPAYL